MTDEITATNPAGGAPRRFRAAFPRQLYKKLLKEAVDQEVAPNEALVRIVERHFGEMREGVTT
jgi:hypothetical protein